MLNPFPILWLSLFAYFILRVCVGAVLISLGVRHFTHYKEIAPTLQLPFFPWGTVSIAAFIVCELAAGTLLILGFYTQIGALLLIALALKCLVWNNWLAHPTFPSRMTYFLLLACGLSLLITGGGAMAFDLPI